MSDDFFDGVADASKAIFRRKKTLLKSTFERKIERLRDQRDEAVDAFKEIFENGVESRKPDTRRCYNCNRQEVITCNLCEDPPYCSLFCKLEDWPLHRTECEPYQRARGALYLHTGIVPDN